MYAIDQKRVEELIRGLASFGGTPEEGVTRLAYSETDRAAQNWLLEQISDLDLTLQEDSVGNVFLRRAGTCSDLPPVACGSHLDTVTHGGAYDGMCGVVGALEALYALKDDELKRGIEVIIFRAEESSCFGFATIGSKLMTGTGSPEEFSKATKADDCSFKDALEQWGCNPARYQEAIRQKGSYHAFVELHIEQGRVLEETGNALGIVHNIAAPTRFKIHIRGVADHSGATPMGFRHDALVTAAKIILAIEKAATEEKENGTVATVGVLDIEPSSINVVPGATTLWVDLRGVDTESTVRTLERIQNAAREYAAEDGAGIAFDMLAQDTPVPLSGELAQRVEALCKARNTSFLHMNSGAGHDAMHMTKLAPTTLLFIPCKEGISHNKAEFASIEDITRGIEILADLLKELANEE